MLFVDVVVSVVVLLESDRSVGMLAMVSPIDCDGNVVNSMSTSSDGGVIPLPSVGVGVALMGNLIGTFVESTLSSTTSSTFAVVPVVSVLGAGETELDSGKFDGITKVVSSLTTIPASAVSESSVADWLVDGLELSVAVVVVETDDVDVVGVALSAGLFAGLEITILNLNLMNRDLKLTWIFSNRNGRKRGLHSGCFVRVD